MINTKRPNTSDYTQVGFLEAKDGQGNYQNIDHIYDSEGNIVFQQGYLNEYDGANDFRIPAIGKPLIDYIIYGNTFQDGVPTPDNPIMPEGTGDRTGNLYGGADISGTINNTYYKNDFVYANLSQGTYTLTFDLTTTALPSHTYSSSIGVGESGYTKDIQIQSGKTDGHFVFTFTIDAEYAGKNLYARFVRDSSPITIDYSASNIMLNLGSEALPYEPYGYKLPIMAGKYEFLEEPLRAVKTYKDTIDLGTKLLTRQIKELVLTGEENWRLNNRVGSVGGQYFNLPIFTQERTEFGRMLCSHYTVANPYDRLTTCCALANYSQGIDVRINNPSTDGNIDAFKSYLTSQYTAGTPVTIWYVLTEPTTETISIPSGLAGIIEGVGIQNGTPTPDNPIMPVGRGKRTANAANLYGVNATFLGLHYTVSENMSIVINGTKGSGLNVHSLVHPNIMLPAGTYTVKVKMVSGSITNLTTNDGLFFGINKNTYAQRTTPGVKQVGDVGTRTFTLNNDTLLSSLDIAPSYGSAGSVWTDATFECWFYAGSDNKPYEPYGYKLDISSGGVNLFDGNYTVAVMSVSGNTATLNTASSGRTAIVKCEPNTTYTVKKYSASNRFIIAESNIKPVNGTAMSIIQNNSSISEYTFTTGDTAQYVGIYCSTSLEQVEPPLMLNHGSTPLPYEPYTELTAPVYLREVETTRKIGKIDLGTLNWSRTASGNFLANTAISDCRVIENSTNGNAICTHLSEVSGNNVANTPYSFSSCLNAQARPFVNKTGFENLTNEEFKEAMSGVYMWYVLATEETGIVNEPLMRIGKYTDSVDFSQAGVQIPTLKRPNTTVIDITTSLPPSEVYAKYRGSKTQKYDLFLAANGDSFEAKNGQSLYIGDDT